MKVGERLRFRLYAGREVEGILRAILKTTAGTKLRMECGARNYVATIDPEQLVKTPSAPGDKDL